MLKWDCYFNIANCIAGELLALYYSYYVSVMIRYINSPDREIGTGLTMVGVFFGCQVLSQIFRNRYLLSGFETSVKMRRILVSALYAKVVRLSMKSMTETGSGKLISLISGDMFSVERGNSLIPIVFAAPIVNIVAYSILAKTVGWECTLIIVVCWLLNMYLQYLSSQCVKPLQLQQS